MDPKLKKIISVLPTDFIIVSKISLLMNIGAFIEYSKKMNQYIIEKSDTDEADRVFIYLPLALMYNNPKMQDFIYDILQKTGYTENQVQFIAGIEKINNHVIDNSRIGQFGGADIKKYLYSFGVIILAAFYNYYIYTNGAWGRISNSIQTLQKIAPVIISGCDLPIKPSKVVALIARGAKNPDAILRMEAVAQCLLAPTYLTDALVKLNTEKESLELIAEFTSNLPELPGFPGFPELPTPKETTSLAIVPYGQNPEEIESKLIGILVVPSSENPQQVNAEQTLKKFEHYANLPPAEFKKLLESGFSSSSTTPATTPISMPTASPTWEKTKSFASDLIGAIQEISDTSFLTSSPSLSIENNFVWTIQDTFKTISRKIEDGKIKGRRQIEDLITEGIRAITDIKTIPSILYFLFLLNLASLRAIIFFIKKISNHEEEPVGERLAEIENTPVAQIENTPVAQIENAPAGRPDIQPGERASERLAILRSTSDDSSLARLMGNLGPLSSTAEANAAKERRGGHHKKRKTIRKQKSKTRKNKRHQKRKQTKAKKGRHHTRKY